MDDAVPSQMTRRMSWGLVVLHFVITAGMLIFMFINTPRSWHRSFFVLTRDPQDVGSTEAGFYRTAMVLDEDGSTSGNWTADSCGGMLAEADTDIELWQGEDGSNVHHIISKRARDICRFQRVGKAWVHAADPRSLHSLSSATPAFLLVSVQVIVFASLLATSSMLKSFFSAQIYGMGRKRVWMPVDQIVAIVILLGWVGFSLLMQSTFVIVYNNILLVGMLAIFTILGIIVWSWRKVAPSSYMAVNEIETPVDEKPVQEQSSAEADIVMDPEQSRLKRKAVVFRMPAFTNAPMVPYSNQGNNDEAEKNPTMHMIDQTFDVLWRNHVLVFPRFIMAASVLPVLLAAAMYKSGSIWLYSDVYYLTLYTFLTTTMCVPLYAMVRICVMVAVDSSAEWKRGRSSLAWFIVVVHLLFAHLLMLLYTTYSFYNHFFAGDLGETQPENNVMDPLLVAASVVVFNLLVWVWCLILVVSPRSSGQSLTVFNWFAWFVEIFVAVCLTAPAGFLLMF